MRGWARKLRGISGLGLFGGLGGALFGSLWWIGEGLLGASGTFAGSFGMTVGLWAGFGAFAAAGAGVLLTTLARVPRLEALSPLRLFVLGALAGGLAPPAFLLLIGGGWSTEAAVFSGISSLLGGVVSSGLVVVARRAPREALPPTDESDSTRQIGGRGSS